MSKRKSKAIPCAHIADYYQFMWLQQPCIGYNLLRRGYREWAEGNVRHHKVNNLYGKPSRPQTSVKQILVRDFNWRMGNLRRWYGGKHVFDDDIQEQIAQLVELQMCREEYRHEGRLTAVLSGDPAGVSEVDGILANALYQAMRAMEEIGQIRRGRISG